MRKQGLFRLHHEEEGATVVIVALCLISLIGMLVLVVDVGGLLWKRREMVSGSDAAALAAAKTCSVPVASDPTDPEVQADTAAAANVGGLNSADGSIVDGTVTCRQPRGFVTVQYSYPQQLFFAGIFGASTRTVTTAATAAWGPLAGGNAVPIVLDQGVLQGPSCDVPDLQPGQTCAFWYDDKDPFGASDWGFLNLDLWGVAPNASCNNAGGTKTLGGYILNNFGTPLPLSDPGPTYVCTTPGHRDTLWDKALQDRMDGLGCKTSPCPGPVLLMPVNDCTQAVDMNGVAVGCGNPKVQKYAIVGFATLQLTGIYPGNTTAAVGTPDVPADSRSCAGMQLGLDSFGTRQIDVLLQASCAGPATIDSIPFDATRSTDPAASTDVTLKVYYVTGNGSKATKTFYKGCLAGGSTSGCDYTFDPSTYRLTWVNPATQTDGKTKLIDAKWITDSVPGTAGFCSPHTSESNAICLVMTWRGYTSENGEVGNGVDFGTQGHVLCDFKYGSCPDPGVKTP